MMAASHEQVELLASAGAPHHANSTASPGTPLRANSSASSHASLHRAENLADFDVNYGRIPDADVTSWHDAVKSRLRGASCKSDLVLKFIERHVPVITLLHTYKVGCHFVMIIIIVVII